MRVARLPRFDPVEVGLAAMLLLGLLIGVGNYYETRSVDRQSYNRCVDRQANTDKLNAFARAMAAVETERGAAEAYRSLVLAPPKCGTP